MGVVKTWNGIARASLKTFNGIASASLKTINGLDATTSAGGTAVVTTSSYTGRDGSFWVGFRFKPNGADLTVTDLGRFITATSASKTRTIKIWNFNSSGSYAEVCSASVDVSTGLNTYQWSAVSGSPVLTNGILYIIASNERDNDMGSSGWAAQTTITYTSVINTVSTAYASANSPAYGDWQGGATGSYAGVNFKHA